MTRTRGHQTVSTWRQAARPRDSIRLPTSRSGSGSWTKRSRRSRTELKVLKKRHESTLDELRAAARNEGALPLFDDLPE